MQSWQSQMGGMMGPKYKPLSEDIAEAAAPVSAAPQKPLYCRVDKGAALFGRSYVDFSQKDFTLVAQDRVNVQLSPKKGGGSFAFQGYFDREGQRLVFCPLVHAAPNERIACTSLYALDDDLEMGIKRTFDIPDALRGGQITCAFNTKNLRKL